MCQRVRVYVQALSLTHTITHTHTNKIQQGAIEGAQVILNTLSAHVALRCRCFDSSHNVAAAAAASGVTAEELDVIMPLDSMEPERKCD